MDHSGNAQRQRATNTRSLIMTGSFPLVGLATCVRRLEDLEWHAVQDKYIAALAVGANVAPVLLPSLGEDYAERIILQLDGLVLPGSSSNISPQRYQICVDAQEEVLDLRRDETTLCLIRRAIEHDIPILAICRGLQELNVACGGTLYRSLHDGPGKMDHRENLQVVASNRYGKAHRVILTDGSWLARLACKEVVEVNSLHGQGIAQLAAKLEIEAVAPDGVIEAVRVRDASFAIGVQWHPEWRFWEDPLSSALFRAFGDAVRKRASERLDIVDNRD